MYNAAFRLETKTVTVLMGLAAQTTLHGLCGFARMHWILGTSLEASHACNGLGG